MKRHDEIYIMKQAAVDRCNELNSKGVKASWFRNKAKQYVVFFWEA